MAPQDTFIDMEEELCPLCIEEFDLSDRNFRPCPCGYKVCQFCFNNIKNNMNGLCPACRRPYDEKTIEYKVVTAEEMAQFRANIQKNQKKRAQEQRQKEAQKREADKESRKNLVGVRVVQKNLVYVTGLTPTIREDELLKTLRKPEFFGQYGTIHKISISNRKSPDGLLPSLGIYVTFDRPDEASRCIQAVNGSQNGDRILKAQLGTTKYCSAWLRHEACTNRQCMFLHELGDEEDSYTRQGLSSMNSIHTQRPLPNVNTPAGPSRQPARSQAQAPPPTLSVAASATAQASQQSVGRPGSSDSSDNAGDGSALPSSANWARNPILSRRGSLATVGASFSPAVPSALPVMEESSVAASENSNVVKDEPAAATAEKSAAPTVEEASAPSSSKAATHLPSSVNMVKAPISLPDSSVKSILRALRDCPYTVPTYDPEVLDRYPLLFDLRGGEKRRAARQAEQRSHVSLEPQQQQSKDKGSLAAQPAEEPEAGGSLALGGEPEDRDPRDAHGFEIRRPGTQPPLAPRGGSEAFGSSVNGQTFVGGDNVVGSRTSTPQQLVMKPSNGFADQLPPGILPSHIPLFQQQQPHQQQQQAGHGRQTSRFNFGGSDNSGPSSSLKLGSNARLLAQQSSMMPSAFQSQTGSSQYYNSGIPAPPPGLKSTGTPPALFSQGHGFGSSGFGAPKEPTSSQDLLSHLIRGRNGTQAHDATKHLADPSMLLMQSPHQQSSAAAANQALFTGQTSQGGFAPGMMYGSANNGGAGYGGRW